MPGLTCEKEEKNRKGNLSSPEDMVPVSELQYADKKKKRQSTYCINQKAPQCL